MFEKPFYHSCLGSLVKTLLPVGGSNAPICRPPSVHKNVSWKAKENEV